MKLLKKKGSPWKKKRGRYEAIKEEIAGRLFSKELYKQLHK
jgi:hypothetical protein